MIELAIRDITRNPTKITQNDEIVRLVDGRTHRTRAYVVPARYEKEIRRLIQRIEDEKWAKEAMRIEKSKDNDNLEEIGRQALETWDEIADR